MIKVKNCKACNGTGQQKGIDGIIRKCPLCEETIVDWLNGAGDSLMWTFIGIILFYLIFFLFIISIFLGVFAVCLIVYLLFKKRYECSKCHHKTHKNHKKCKNCGVIFTKEDNGQNKSENNINP